MSLVAYNANSSSEEDGDIEIKPRSVSFKKISQDGNCDVKFMITEEHIEEGVSTTTIPLQLSLPSPCQSNEIIKEVNDEFLHKKSTLTKPPVRITIQPLSQFEKKRTSLCAPSAGMLTRGPDSLLSLLPPALNKKTLVDKQSTEFANNRILVPDSVSASKRHLNDLCTKKQNNSLELIQSAHSDSEEEDTLEDLQDFLKLKEKQTLPEVNFQVVQQMLIERAANLGKSKQKYQECGNVNPVQSNAAILEEPTYNRNRHNMNEEEIQALCGMGKVKRLKQIDAFDIIELTENDILPKKDEWLRSATQFSTEYQSRGGLVEEELEPGTKRKGHIKYLAYRAKANEEELQLMWSTNKHARRLTQNKYGF